MKMEKALCLEQSAFLVCINRYSSIERNKVNCVLAKEEVTLLRSPPSSTPELKKELHTFSQLFEFCLFTFALIAWLKTYIYGQLT